MEERSTGPVRVLNCDFQQLLLNISESCLVDDRCNGNLRVSSVKYMRISIPEIFGPLPYSLNTPI